MANEYLERYELNEKEKVHIVLIWGTFASEAEWVQKGSFFRTTLRRILKGFGVDCEFHIFSWSGVNSHVARRDASSNLEGVLFDLSEKTKDDIFVVGHSHGGSVAYNALSNNPKLKSKVSRLFSLSLIHI